MEKVVNRQSVDWYEYFKSIRSECPWSYKAYTQGKVDIVQWRGEVTALGDFEARVYVIDAEDSEVEALAEALDYGEDEWLFSYPKYGEYATPVKVLIQQNRRRLSELRERLNAST